jgi:RHS repeat-associated protein
MDRSVANVRAGGQRGRLGRFRSFALLIVAVSTILATVGLLAAPPQPAAATTAHTAAIAAAATKGAHNTPLPTSTSSPLSALQSAYATTTIAANGLHQTVLSSVPTNYKDSSGKWQAINNALAATASGGWHNTANSVSVQLPSDLSSAVALGNGGAASIGFTLVGANHTAANVGTVSGSTATYPDALPATTVTEQAVTSGVKESLSLAAATAPRTFTWDLDLGTGLHASADGAVIDIDSATSKVATIAAPTVTDAAGAVGSASYALNAAGTTLSLTISPTWLATPARAFPVTVDPTTYFINGGDACVLNQGSPTITGCYYNDLAVGYSGGEIQRSIINYPDLGNGVIPVDAQISSAQLSLPVVSLTGSVTVNAYPLSRAYTNGNVTWDTYDGTNNWTTLGGDYSSSPTTSATAPSSGTMSLNISTALAQSWVDGSATNNGLLLKASNESSGTNLAEFDPQSDNEDQLIVTWSPNVGVAPGDPIITHTLDDRMTLGVNAANGNLVLHDVDLSINGTGLNEVMDRYYNSEDLSTFVGSGDSWSLGEGAGVYAQVNSDNVTVWLPGGQPAVFMDNGASWTTPPGVNAVLSEPSSGNYSLTFNQTQEVIKFATEGSCTGGQLPEASVSDRNGETITYNYSATACDASGQAFLTSVTDTEGRTTTVTNNGYFYNGLDDPSPGLVVRYDVNSDIDLVSSEDTSDNYTYYTYGGSGAELTQIEDPDGNYTVISYDSSGRVSSLTYVTDVSTMTGPTYTFAYSPGTTSSPNSGSTTVTDPNSNTTTYYYNVDDQQTKVTDGNGNSDSTGYNAEPTTLTDAMTPAGVSTNSYDTNDNATESQEPANGSDTAATSYTNYSLPSGTLGNTYLPSSSVNAEAGCSVYGYDANGNETDAYTGEASVSGAGEGSNPGCSSTSTYASHSSAGYDGDSGVSCTNAKPGEMCWSKDADGNETTYAYTSSGDLFSVTPPAPQGPTLYYYDSLSREVAVDNGNTNGGTAPATPGTISPVQTASTALSSSDVSSESTTMPSGTQANDVLVAIVGTNSGSPVTSVSSLSGGGVTTWNLGKAVSSTTVGDEEIWYGIVTSSGSTTVTVNMSSGTHKVDTEVIEYTGVNLYDTTPLVASATSSGNSSSVSTPSLSATGSGDIVIDAANTLNAVSSSPSSPWVDYAGPTGNKSPVTTQVVTTTGSYSTSWGLSSSTHWLSAGIVLEPQPSVNFIGYDNMDRVTIELFGGDPACLPATGNCIYYTYDADGNVTSRGDSTGTTTYTYDALNRLIDVSNPGGTDACAGSSPAGITYTYDGASNLTSSCDALGTTDYNYDAGNRLTSEIEPGGTSGCSVATHTTEPGCTAFSYDDDNHLLVTLFPGGAKQTSTWTANGKMASIVGANSSSTTETSFVYTYASGTQDEDLVQTRVENDPSVSSATTVTYGYNANNALTSAVTTGGSSSTLDYYYDAAGNRCSAAASGTPALCPTGSGDYASNADDELTTSPSGSYSYDAAGNLLSTPQLSNLTYNTENQTSSVTPSGGSAIASTYSNTGQAERTSDGLTTLVSGTFGADQSTTSGTTTYFIRTNTGTVIGEHVGSTSYYYLHDNEGTVVAVISSSGTVEDRDGYDPYGQVTSSSGSTANPFGYASGYTDAATGLVQFGTRYYNPSIGLFTQEDPSGQSAGYLYVGDNPVNGTDPSGMFCLGLCTITNAAESIASSAEATYNDLLKLSNELASAEGGQCQADVGEGGLGAGAIATKLLTSTEVGGEVGLAIGLIGLFAAGQC